MGFLGGVKGFVNNQYSAWEHCHHVSGGPFTDSDRNLTVTSF